jgi:transposase
MAQLTERQQDIKNRLENGDKADKIAKDLGISTNAVYQQIRRMRNAGNAPAKKSGRQSARKLAAAPAIQQAVLGQARAMTPLQAIRARRDEIKAELKATESAVLDAERTLKSASEAHEKASTKRAEEIKQLDSAESALTGKPTPAQVERAAKRAASAPQKPASAPAKPKGGAKPQTAPSDAQDGQEAPKTGGTKPVATTTNGTAAKDAERAAQDAAAEAPQTPATAEPAAA